MMIYQLFLKLFILHLLQILNIFHLPEVEQDSMMRFLLNFIQLMDPLFLLKIVN